MNYIKYPNLPENDVKCVIISNRAEEEIKALRNMGIYVILTPDVSFLDKRICHHPDMMICHLGENRFAVLDEVKEYFINQISEFCKIYDCEIFNNLILKGIPRNEFRGYKEESRLNVAKMGKYTICNLKYVDKALLEPDGTVIDVNQGYSKCSTLILDSNALITSDMSINNAVGSNGIISFYVEPTKIKLTGFENGFMGGIGGKISKNKIAVCGNANELMNNKQIYEYLIKNDFEIIRLSAGALTDYGSILPIIE